MKTLEEQAQAIMEDISRLESADSVVLAKIDSLAGNDDTIKGLIDALGNADAGLKHLIDSLAGNDNTIKGLIDALGNADTGLKHLIDSLAGNDNTIKGLIETLQNSTADSLAKLRNADVVLNNAITSLRTYVDGELKSGITSDLQSWVSGSYATLARQNALADSLATVYTEIGNLQTKVGGWISSALKDYFTAAMVQAKVDSVGSIISGIDSKYSKGIDTLGQHLRSEMEAVKTAITSGYEGYIATAIAQGGSINKAIHDSIASLRTYVNGELSTINGKITAIETRLNALENVVQSVVFVPEYDDGKIFVPSEYEDGKYINTKVDIKLRYKINTLNSNFDPAKYTITGDLIEAMATTKSSYVGARIDFKDKKYDKTKSVLECTFNTESIPASFYDESKSAALSLNITDGKTDISSSFVGLRLQKTTGGGGGGGEGGGGDEPGDVFRVNPSSITVGASGGNFDGRITCLNDYAWLVESIEYSSGSNWVEVEVLKDAERENIGSLFNPNYIYYYTGYADIVVVVDPYVGEENRTATVTFTHGSTTDNPVRITMTITQNGRPEQDLTIDPEEIINEGMEFDWQGNRTDGNGLSYQFTVIPSDQMYDYSVSVDPISAESWVNIERERLNNSAALVTVTANTREKGYDSYYRDNHEAYIVVTSKTGGSPYRIPVKQLFHPKSNLTFDPASLEMKFNWDDGADERQFITITPDDQLPNWSVVTDPAGEAAFNKLFTRYGFDTSKRTLDQLLKNVSSTIRNIINSLVGDELSAYLERNYPDVIYGKDSQTGISTAYVYPAAVNKSFDSEVTAKIIFTSAAPVGTEGNTYTLNITQGKRPLQELEFDKSDTQVDFDWDGKTTGSRNDGYVIKVTPKDNQEDWLDPVADAGWIHIGRRAVQGTAAANVTITVDECTKLEGGVRTGNVTFKSADGKIHKTLAIRQTERPDQSLRITGSPDENYILTWNDKSKYTLTITPDDSQPDWECDGGDDDFKEFFSISGVGARGANGVGTITVGISKNNTSLTDNKTGKLTFTSATGSTEAITFTISARTEAQTLSITGSPDENYTFSWKAKDNGAYIITVDPSDDSGDWLCTPDEHFEDYFNINGVTTRAANGNGTITVTAKINNRSLTDDLKAQLTIASATGGTPTVITFTQTKCPAAQIFTNASPEDGSTLVFKQNGRIRGSNSNTSYSIAVTTSDGLDDWTYDADEDWISLNKGNGSLTVSVAGANNTGANRSGTVTIYSANGDATLTYTVTQAKDNLFWSSVTSKQDKGKNGTFSITLYNNKEVNGAATVSATGLTNNVKINNSKSFSSSIDDSLEITIYDSVTRSGAAANVTFTITYWDGTTDSFVLTIGNDGLFSNNYYVKPAD